MEEVAEDESIKLVCDLFKALGGLKKAELKKQVAALPEALRQELLARLDAKVDSSDDEEKDEAKDKADAQKQVRRKEKEKQADFLKYYEKIKRNMKKNLLRFKNGAKISVAVYAPLEVELQQFINAKDLDSQWESATTYVSQAVQASIGCQEMAFACGIIEAKRWVELKAYWTKNKATFQQSHPKVTTWNAFVKHLNLDRTPSQVEGLLQLHHVWCCFPNISLISFCTLQDFLQHWKRFCQHLEENDEEKEAWCCNEEGEYDWKHEIAFEALQLDGKLLPVGRLATSLRRLGKADALEQGGRLLKPLVEKHTAERKREDEHQENIAQTSKLIKRAKTRGKGKEEEDEEDLEAGGIDMLSDGVVGMDLEPGPPKK